MKKTYILWASCFASLLILSLVVSGHHWPRSAQAEEDQLAQAAGKVAIDKSGNPEIKPGDCAMWGLTSARNNTPEATGIPTSWEIGGFDRKTGEWKKDRAENIKWIAPVGSQTYGNPVVADGRMYVGTNNGAGYMKRYPANIDLGCMICFSETDGSFLWQHSSEKLPTGRVHDWPLQGICCAPYVEGKRIWFVTSRGEVVCCDTEGFHDGEDDGPEKASWGRLFDEMKPDREIDPDAVDNFTPALAALKGGKLTDYVRETFAARGMPLPAGDIEIKSGDKPNSWQFSALVGGADRQFRLMTAGPKLSAFKLVTADDKDEADTIWTYNMMSDLKTSQHNMCSCSVIALGDILFVNTSNGLDESHINLPAPRCSQFRIAMDKNTGERSTGPTWFAGRTTFYTANGRRPRSA